jgi:glycosyltransferase involved in cell wall biosynthesis
MIVKNEETQLADCLDSLVDIMDEIIIVDTGSTDRTKEIAAGYTSNIYDYKWNDDFAAARNFAFSKATGDYIYSADADEVIDRENQDKLMELKRTILPEIEIVQMIYITEQINHPTENFARDMRPKLFKRLRQFTWIEPVHETVNLNPVVYDSDIEIHHWPKGNHSGRDFGVFEKIITKNGTLSDRLMGMYIRELYKAGEAQDLEKPLSFFENALLIKRSEKKETLCRQIIALLLKAYRQLDNPVNMLKFALSPEATVPSAEICMELGHFFMKNEDYPEAAEWFYRAVYDCESDIDVASSGAQAYMALALCYRKYANSPVFRQNFDNEAEYESEKKSMLESANDYERLAIDWKPAETPLL